MKKTLLCFIFVFLFMPSAWPGSIVIPVVPSNTIDAITDIDPSLKSGSDGTLVTGTKGTSGNCAEWNADGDLVDAGGACGGATAVEDDAYGAGWDEDTSNAPSQNAVYDKIETLSTKSGDTYTGAHDFGGATLETPNGTDPDVTAAGQISHDTDGNGVTFDETLRGYDSSGNQIVWAHKIKQVAGTVIKPEDWLSWPQRTNPGIILYPNFAMGDWHLTEIFLRCSEDNVVLDFFETASSTDFRDSTDTPIDSVTASTNGAGDSCFYANETTFSHGVIEYGHVIFIELNSGTPNGCGVVILGWEDGDVD